LPLYTHTFHGQECTNPRRNQSANDQRWESRDSRNTCVDDACWIIENGSIFSSLGCPRTEKWQELLSQGKDALYVQRQHLRKRCVLRHTMSSFPVVPKKLSYHWLTGYLSIGAAQTAPALLTRTCNAFSLAEIAWTRFATSWNFWRSAGIA
jgi:hypothetical protein